jgi:4-hydroxybenzoate polyprenyltransferase
MMIARENVMNNSLLLALFIASILLNVIDAILTRIAVRRGHRERNSFIRKLIEKLGLDKAMIVKVFSVVPLLVIFVIIGWNNPIIGLYAIISLIIVVVFYSCVVIQNCLQLLKSHSKKMKKN